VQVGAVGGIGQGERIYAVRFMGERGSAATTPAGSSPAAESSP